MPAETAVARRTFDASRAREDFPILREIVHGKPLVYLDNANTTQKPQRVLDALDDYYRHANANIHRATHLLSERATQALRGRAGQSRAVHQRARDRRDRPHEGLHRRPEPRGAQLRAAAAAAGRRNPRLVDGAPLQHRAVADRLRADRRDAARRADHRRAASCGSTSSIGCSAPRTRLVAIIHVSNALGTIVPVRDDDRARPRPRRAGAGRRRAVGGAPAGRRPGARLRLLRVLVAQDVRPDRVGRALRQAPLARGDAAVPGRRRHDRVGHLREDDLQRGAAQVRGGHAEHRRRRRLRRRGRLPAAVRHVQRLARGSTSCSTYATEAVRARAGPAHARARRATRRACCRS